MDVLDNILDTMKENGVQQQSLAANLGIHKNNITEWKQGRTKSYMKYLPQIADFLGVSVDYLLGKTDLPKNEVPEPELDETERIVVESFRSLSAAGKAKAIQFLLNLCDMEKSTITK